MIPTACRKQKDNCGKAVCQVYCLRLESYSYNFLSYISCPVFSFHCVIWIWLIIPSRRHHWISQPMYLLIERWLWMLCCWSVSHQWQPLYHYAFFLYHKESFCDSDPTASGDADQRIYRLFSISFARYGDWSVLSFSMYISHNFSKSHWILIWVKCCRISVLAVIRWPGRMLLCCSG